MGFPAPSPSSSTHAAPVEQHGSHARRQAPPYLENSLVDPRFDVDSCGVGFVARLSDEPSHEILKRALTALARLEHRGAVAADGKSSDGVGVTVVIPREWLLAQTGVILPAWKPLGVGVIFLSTEDGDSRAEIESALRAQGMEALLWRPVPVRPEVLGEIANSTRPAIWHLLITSDEQAGFNRRLFLARKQFERSGFPGYIASISSATMV
jgi:glutamate synthase (ferredoxin)